MPKRPHAGKPIERLYLTRIGIDAEQTKPWGGLHVTVAGQGFGLTRAAIRATNWFQSNGNDWTFSGSPKAKLEQWKSTYVIAFKSQSLDALAQELIGRRCHNVKGPHGTHSTTSWHISLDGHSKKQAEAVFQALVNAPGRPHWGLTISQEFADGSFYWDELRPTAAAGGGAVVVSNAFGALFLKGSFSIYSKFKVPTYAYLTLELRLVGYPVVLGSLLYCRPFRPRLWQAQRSRR
jgi:hypothetical protein